MGEQRLDEFRTDVRYQLGNRSDLDPSDPTAAARLNRWINRAQRWAAHPLRARHQELKKHDQTITLLDGTTRYMLPSAVFALRFLVDETAQFKFDPMQDLDFLDRDAGNSRLYAKEGRDVLIRGDSSNDGDIVRIYYWARPAPLVLDADVSELDLYWDEVILQRATALGAAGLRDLDAADFFNNAAAELVTDWADAQKFEAEDSGWKAEMIRQGPQTMRIR